MGGAPSKQQPKELRPPSSVKISPQLLLQLSGKQPLQDQADGTSRDGSAEQSAQDAMQAQLYEAARENRALQQVLEHSRRVGDLLLKSEDEELPRVSEYAEQLLDHEYRAPVKRPPCEDAKQACTDCYALHPQDSLRCASVVDAYKTCAEKAFRVYLGVEDAHRN